MKQIKYLISTFLILCVLSCKSIHGIGNINSDQADVIQAYFEIRKDKNLFFKSLDSPSSSSTLSGLINYGILNTAHDIPNRKAGVKFENIFTPQELERLRYKAHAMEVIKFDKEQLKNVVVSKNMDDNTLKISSPIISSDRVYALLYVESTGGGEFIVFKKTDDHWQRNYVLSDWIS